MLRGSAAGYNGSGSSITIEDGTVTATGGELAAGIGGSSVGSNGGSGSDITISGGMVTVAEETPVRESEAELTAATAAILLYAKGMLKQADGTVLTL